jgi:hypothetical protein
LSTPISRNDPPVNSEQVRMADTPHPVSAPFQGFRSLKGMKQSTRYGILLFLLQSSESYELSEGQRLWIIYRARKLSEAELLKAGEFSEKLISDEVLRQRTKHQINETHIRVPSLNPKQLPEKRRIGIGYRDKGALRPLHHQRRLGERTVWSEDIQYLLPLDSDLTGRWITADEVESLIGVDRLLMSIAQIQSQFSESLSTVFSVNSDPG